MEAFTVFSGPRNFDSTVNLGKIKQKKDQSSTHSIVSQSVILWFLPVVRCLVKWNELMKTR